MTKARVYELAKELELSTKELLRVLSTLGISVKSHMSMLEEKEVSQVKDHLQKIRAPLTPKVTPPEQRGQKPLPLVAAVKDKETEGERPRPFKKPKEKQPIRFKKQEWIKEPKREKVVPLPAKLKKISMGERIAVGELAKKLAQPSGKVIQKLISLGVVASVNAEIDVDTATLVAEEFGTEVEVKREKLTTFYEDLPDAPESLKERPPVVTVMGHVDHGKTSLLDAIRKTNVTATEFGGITQHIGAYQVELNNRKITFIDTPGHEAFTAMRARGAQATDIAVLVVAADDGVMPQTVEAINHAKAAKVPVILAINKIDKPDANPERVKQQLTEYGLVPEEWGGDTICVLVSALKKQGIDQLLEMILLVAELAELKANPDRPARGVVIEAKLDKGRGAVATVLVQKGTLRMGESLVVGNTYGKIRAMFNDQGKRIDAAPPSTPVELLGLEDVPLAGDIFQVVPDEKLAREIALQRQTESREKEFERQQRVRLEDLFKRMEAGEVKELNLILKADVQGSLEALSQALQRLSTDEVKVNIIHRGVGGITETDVMLAAASQAIIIGFNVRPDAGARRLAENERIEIRVYRVIYDLIDDVKAALGGLLAPEIREVFWGRAEVRKIFRIPRVGTIAGSYVTEGKIVNRASVRVIRDGVVIHEGHLQSLKRFKDDVREVPQGYECGIGVEGYQDLKEGDILEVFTHEEVKREL